MVNRWVCCCRYILRRIEITRQRLSVIVGGKAIIGSIAGGNAAELRVLAGASLLSITVSGSLANLLVHSQRAGCNAESQLINSWIMNDELFLERTLKKWDFEKIQQIIELLWSEKL